MGVDLTLNGRPQSLESSRETPLLWALRDEKSLVGVKFGCGAGLCGACTIIIDGQQARACQTQVGDVAGKSVTTIEGLDGAVAEAVRKAWVRAQAPQCGYCQPGFVMATTSVIAANPRQSRDAVLGQITNLCRCGTYDAIRVAVGYALDALNAPQKQGSAQ
ncbi:MAG: (2Fe-2S)-binding protein [Hyphomicrobiales bacterium]|nr:(2Fe-2S)-binding protein [Hyphomicrobiales bacterium]